MPLNQSFIYEPLKGIEYTQNKELKIIRLLQDVRENAGLLRPDLENIRLDTVLEVVENGKWEIQARTNPKNPQVELNYLIDLSKAKKIVDEYRNLSEGGCEYCTNYTKFHNEEKNLTGVYCKAEETEANINWLPIASNNTLKIRDASRNHCPDRIPRLRLLEEILQDALQESTLQSKN